MLLQLDYLTKKDYEDWRYGRVDYLESVCKINLSKLTTTKKLIGKYTTELNLKNSWNRYNQFDVRVKLRLRFSKSGGKNIEDSYGMHYSAGQAVTDGTLKGGYHLLQCG
ncbi:MAG TPA: hypothetical protein DDY13_17310 [Cytophagales bacterium]|jgi:hypothetical protein|nr:hypothetical protein [Cytophagales bacterium]